MALNVGPTVVFVALAKGLGWPPETCAVLRLPLIFTPLVTALAVTSRAEGPGAAARLAGRFLVPPRRKRWFVVALLVFPLLACVALALRWALFDVGVIPRDDLGLSRVLGLSLFLFLFPGVTEELGWRGFLQPRLERRFPPLVASALVGLTWGLWHGHSLASDPERYNAHTYPWFLLLTVGTALVIGWIQGRGDHSVPLAMTGHYGANAVFAFFPMGEYVEADGRIWKLLAGVTVAAGVGLHLGLPPRSPAPHEARSPASGAPGCTGSPARPER